MIKWEGRSVILKGSLSLKLELAADKKQCSDWMWSMDNTHIYDYASSFPFWDNNPRYMYSLSCWTQWRGADILDFSAVCPLIRTWTTELHIASLRWCMGCNLNISGISCSQVRRMKLLTRMLVCIVSLLAKLLPSVPGLELANAEPMKTIEDHLHLFKIVTLINMDCFEELWGLTQIAHSWRQSAVDYVRVSVLGQTQGTRMCHLLWMSHFQQDKAIFLWAQWDHEQSKGMFSGSFSQDLLPGIHAFPIHAVPTPIQINCVWS